MVDDGKTVVSFMLSMGYVFILLFCWPLFQALRIINGFILYLWSRFSPCAVNLVFEYAQFSLER